MIVKYPQYGDLLSDIAGTVGKIFGIGSQPPPPPPPPSFFETGPGIAVLAAGGVLLLGTIVMMNRGSGARSVAGYGRYRRHRKARR